MVIEWLKFNVSPDLREQFIQKDDEIWTAALSGYPGFLGKEVWISPDNGSEVIQVIRWSSLEAWQSIPGEELQQIEARFNEAIGNTYQLVESTRHHVNMISNAGI